MRLSSFLLIMFLLLSVSCNNNPLRTNENSLKGKVLSDEIKQKRKEISREDPVEPLPPGFRYKENRVADPSNPPGILDFTKDLPVKKLKISDIASRVRYVVLEVPGDSLYFEWYAQIRFAGDNIIVNNNLGIHRFSSDGKYLGMICRNRVDSPRDRLGFISKETFAGAWINHVDVAGNSVFYKYTDYPAKRVTLYRFSLDTPNTLYSKSAVSEAGSSETFAKGDPIVSGDEDISRRPGGLSSTGIHAVSDNFYSGIPGNGAEAFANDAPLLSVFNKAGDTICIFKQYDHLVSPVTSGVIRSFGNLSWFAGKLPSYKWAFNDTVFRLLVPDRLLPAYVFNFGRKRISADDWLHVNASIDGKMNVTDIIEDSRYLFLTYCTYPADNSRGKLYRKAVYDKSSGMLFDPGVSEIEMKAPPAIGSAPVNAPYKPAGLENDLDEGISFWPSLVTGDGKLAARTTAESLKAYIQSPYFHDNGKGFAEFVRSLRPGNSQAVIMILE